MKQVPHLLLSHSQRKRERAIPAEHGRHRGALLRGQDEQQ